MPLAEVQTCLLCRVGTLHCALPVADIVETLRPPPLETLPAAPDFVGGVAIVRGTPVPVITVARLFGTSDTAPARLVIVRAGNRRVGLAFDEVIGFRALSDAALVGLPPLVSEAHAKAVRDISTLDGQLLVLLEAARIVPAGLFTQIDARALAS